MPVAQLLHDDEVPASDDQNLQVAIAEMDLRDLDRLIQQANERKHELLEDDIAAVRAEIIALADMTGRSVADIAGVTVSPRPPARKVLKKAVARFRNPDNQSQTWSGRGKRPRWLQERLERGAELDDFRVAD